MPSSLSHLTGCLAGLALGDALGTPTQPTPEATRELYGGPVTTFLAPGPDDPFGHAGLKAGQITDDTQAALALANAVIREGRFSLEIAAHALVEWLDRIDAASSPYIGPSTKAAYHALKRGVPPTKSGLGGATNGAAMRVAPLGFLRPDDLRATARLAAESAVPTHNTPIGLASAAAVACAVAQAAQSGTLDQVIEAAAFGAEEGARLYSGPPPFTPTPNLARRIRWAVDLTGLPVSRLSGLPPDPHRWPDSVWQVLRELYDLVGAGMAAHETVPTAFALVALARGDPLTAALLAANLGGDGDTIGAIAGAVCGAYRGVEAIPAEMIETLESVNRLDFRQLAQAFLQAIGKTWFV